MIVDDRGDEVSPGSIGEVAVCSRATTSGYVAPDALSKEKFRGDWYFTGDLGKLNGDGRLFLTGRKSSFVNVAGFKVDPGEVEDVLLTHPAIRECAVVGTCNDSAGTEVLKACIVATSPLLRSDIIAFCRQRLAGYKVPRRIEFVQQLPRSPSGKVVCKDLID